MKQVQAEMMCALLERVFSKGLLSKSAYERAVDLVHSDIDNPAETGYSCDGSRGAEPAPQEKGERENGHSESP